MKRNKIISALRTSTVALMLATSSAELSAQDNVLPDTAIVSVVTTDSIGRLLAATDTVTFDEKAAKKEQKRIEKEARRAIKAAKDHDAWRPDPQRAMWLGMVIPGAGQIYNRKYWKLPIFYGGIMGCLYAMNWNNMMYKDYSQAYLDIMDDDPTTQSYNMFLHLGMQINEANEERYKKIFKSRKDKYRRWRDLSFFCLLGVYALSVIDAYVDAELSEFDISNDLSLRVEPAVLRVETGSHSLENAAIGLQCSFTF